jgi:5-formyltetrahydrofolate cyclo-ligase
MTDKQVLRLQLKRIRAALSARERGAATAAAVQRVRHLPQFRRARRVAAYVGSNGELDPMPLLELAADLNKQCFLPVLHPFRSGRLWFCRWRPGERLVPNRFGIPEPLPRSNGVIATRHLELVIVPLLGFDRSCQRLGMGGGYYDRSFAFLHHLKHAKRPFLLGFAHESQKVDSLQTQPWDIQLDAVVTNQRLYKR